MSKRARVVLTQDLAAKAGLEATEFPEGKRWLMKALNPNDASQAAIGIPSRDYTNISCLNYQTKFDITAPTSVSAATPAYDIDLFLNQNALLYGVSIAYPTGTDDFSEIEQFQLAFTGTALTTDGRIVITPSNSPKKSPAFRVTQQLINNQINPEVFRASGSLSSRRLFYSQLAQKARMSYGGSIITPTCSELNNGGSISVCQQICQPRQTVLSDNSSILLNSYNNQDFPDTEDIIQNPQMYFARFFDGAYIPYKLRDPGSAPFIPSELQITTRSPYVVTGMTVLGVTAFTANNDYTIGESPLTLTNSPNSTSFSMTNSIPFYCSAANRPLVTAIRCYVTTLTGQRGYFDYSLQAVTGALSSQLFFTSDLLTTPCTTVTSATYANEGLRTAPDPTTIDLVGKNAFTLVMPNLLTCYQTTGAGPLDNPRGIWFFSQDVSTGPDALVNPEIRQATIPENLGNTLVSVHMSGVSSTAPVSLTVRSGIEIQLTAASVYSPFKFISPQYDESALKSYARCTRVMRDAFFGNAGSDAGQADFIQRLMTLINYNSPDDLSRIMNQGGKWQGTIGG